MWRGVQGRGFLLTNCLTFGNYWVAPKPSVFALYCVYCFTSSWLLISVLLHFCFCLLYTHSFTVLQFYSLLFMFFVSMFTVHSLGGALFTHLRSNLLCAIYLLTCLVVTHPPKSAQFTQLLLTWDPMFSYPPTQIHPNLLKSAFTQFTQLLLTNWEPVFSYPPPSHCQCCSNLLLNTICLQINPQPQALSCKKSIIRQFCTTPPVGILLGSRSKLLGWIPTVSIPNPDQPPLMIFLTQPYFCTKRKLKKHVIATSSQQNPNNFIFHSVFHFIC